MSDGPVISMSAEGLDGLQPTRFVIREAVSQAFRVDLEFRTQSADFNPASLLGKHVSLTYELQTDGGVRTVDGLASRAAIVGQDRLEALFTARLRPFSWFLRDSGDCRIFQNLSAPDIVTSVMSARGFGPLEWNLTKEYPVRDFCVQYNESDANFVHRLLEEEGIAYAFQHALGSHTMAFFDDLTTVGPIAGYEEICFQPGPVAAAGRPDYFRSWRSGRSVRTRSVALRDYDFTKPRVDLTQEAEVADPSSLPAEEYRFPGGYTDAGVGTTRVGARLDALRTGIETVQATGSVRGAQPAALMTVSMHPRADQNRDYVILAAEHRIMTAWSADEPGDPPWYQGRYRLQPATNPFRPRRSYRRPSIPGPQTAIVVGPAGEEIYTDNYGRIKVQFRWDRNGKNNEESSCWVRCVQALAGKGFGAFALPRIVQEVVVEFQDGDPDCPLVTGTFYNFDMTGPLTLPDQASCTSLKTKTIGAESPDQGHELTFEDAAGSEFIRLHSERDFERVVENNDALTVGFDKQEPGDQTIDIFNNQTVTIGDGSASDGSQSITIKSNRDVTLNEGDDSLTISKGDWTVALSAGSANISAGKKIVLQVGDSQLTLDSSGITLKATQIAIQADGSFTAKGADIQEEASASMTLKGGVVQIN